MSTTTLRRARKEHLCSTSWRDEHSIEPGQLYARHVGFPGEEGCEEATAPVVLIQCGKCADEGGEHVRHQYGVPARFGGRVTVDGRAGTITGFYGGHLKVLFDGETAPHLGCHPTWHVTYGGEQS